MAASNLKRPRQIESSRLTTPTSISREKIFRFLSEEGMFLSTWFERWAQDQEVEIEARIKGITKEIFEEVRHQLSKNPFWSRQKVTKSVDVLYQNGVRATYSNGTSLYIEKTPMISPEDVDMPDSSHRVRFSAQSEKERPRPPQGVKQSFFRSKKRWTFVHKEEIKYELTEVNQAKTATEAMLPNNKTIYEIELEWCGQTVAKHTKYPPIVCRDKLLHKVADILYLIAKYENSSSNNQTTHNESAVESSTKVLKQTQNDTQGVSMENNLKTSTSGPSDTDLSQHK